MSADFQSNRFLGKTYWLVGASEGLGLALAQRLASAGANVVISARSAAKLEEAAASIPRARAVAMDVGNSASVTAAAATVGTIDGVVFLAGIYTPMTAQNWNPAEVEAMCAINVTGCARVVGAVLPVNVIVTTVAAVEENSRTGPASTSSLLLGRSLCNVELVPWLTVPDIVMLLVPLKMFQLPAFME